MPKTYGEEERKIIISELRKEAMESLLSKGVKKTTVDDLIEKVKIPKGTFYLFYPSKEMLLYDALMQYEEKTHILLCEKIKEIQNCFSIDSLTNLLFGFFMSAFEMGIMKLMVGGEIDILMRKLPKEVVENHISKDDEFLSVFKILFPSLSRESLSIYSASFRALFFTVSYKREIGEYFELSLRHLISGIVREMWEEEQ